VAKKLAFSILLSLVCPGALALADAALPPRNPWLAAGPFPMSHHNPAQTDVSVVEGPTQGKQLERGDTQTVPVVWCSAPIVKQRGEHTTVIAGTPHGLVKIDATGEAFDVVSLMPYPAAGGDPSGIAHADIARHMARIDEKRRRGEDSLLLSHTADMLRELELNPRNAGSGVYGLIDKDGYHYTSYLATRLVKSFDGNEIGAPLVPVRHVAVTDGLPEAEARGIDRILGISMTPDGHLVAAATGALFVFDRELQRKDVLLFPGEHVENSIAIDGEGIYLVTSKQMRRVVWTGEKLSMDEADGAWASAYAVMPEGEAMRMGAASHGSGTTPALLGFGDDADKLVVISDGHPEGTQLVAFWREAIPEGFEQKPGTLSRRIADQIRIGVGPATIEASPVVYGNGVAVLNSTYPNPAPARLGILGNAFLAGTTRVPPLGVQKFEWKSDENRFVESWLLEDIDTTDLIAPAVSPQNGLAYVATKVDGVYEYRAVDWTTGELVARWPFPDDSVLWNNWGGITTLLEDGDLLLGGFFAVKRYDIGHLR